MPRPKRIEYENAFFHVMNRGRGKMTIFHDERYYQAFLATLGEACKRFQCVIHGYELRGVDQPLTFLFKRWPPHRLDIPPVKRSVGWVNYPKTTSLKYSNTFPGKTIFVATINPPATSQPHWLKDALLTNRATC